MKHFIRIAFWIFTLSGCLQAIPTQTMGSFTAESDLDIDELLKQIQCDQDSEFYIQKNVKDECMTAALDCFLRELNGTVRMECKDPNTEIINVLMLLDAKINERLKAGHVLNNSTACACENESPLPFKDFLTGLESLLQQLKN